MGTIYHVNEFDEVVPCVDGRTSNSTSDRRYTTDFEKQLLEEIKELKTEIEELQANSGGNAGYSEGVFQSGAVAEFREEADFINELYGLGDEDHDKALNRMHIYELMRKYAQRTRKCETQTCNNKIYYQDYCPYCLRLWAT